MLNKQKVYDYLLTITDLDIDGIKKYDLIIDNEIKSCGDKIVSQKYENDERIIALIGAKVNYQIMLVDNSKDGVTNFSAGDISITQNNDCLYNAKLLVENAYKNCNELLSDVGFAFLEV